jgi:DNA helicase-2/ATP-dependent DNA helicase PcrA
MKVPTEAAEAEQIARDIEKRTGGISFFSFDSGITSGDGGTSPEVQPGGNPSVSLSDIAVLCRTGMQIPRFRRRSGISYPLRHRRDRIRFQGEPFRSFFLFCRNLFRSDRGPSFPHSP